MAGQRVGYVRVSTADQNTERQLDGHQLDRLFTDPPARKLSSVKSLLRRQMPGGRPSDRDVIS
jgi:hypothetical protein